MDYRVEAFLAKKEQEKRDVIERQKGKLLLSLGIYNKVYSPTNEYSEEYPYAEYNEVTHETLWYKRDVPGITDEEYQELLKHAKQTNEQAETKGKNTVAVIMTVIAVLIFIFGFVAGLVVIDSVNGTIPLIIWIGTVINGMLFVSIAEIIKLLHNIANK